MLGICQEPSVGAVGAKLYYRDETIQHAGVYVQGTGCGTPQFQPGSQREGLLPHGFEHTRSKRRNLSLRLDETRSIRRSRGVFGGVRLSPSTMSISALSSAPTDTASSSRQKPSSIITNRFPRDTRRRSPNKCDSIREASLLNATWPEYFVMGDPFMNRNLHPNCGYFRLDDRDLD